MEQAHPETSKGRSEAERKRKRDEEREDDVGTPPFSTGWLLHKTRSRMFV